MTNRETFDALAAYMDRSSNPAAEFVLCAAVENATDSRGGTAYFYAGDDFVEEKIDAAGEGNEAFWSVALSTLATWMDDASMWDGYRRERTGSMGDFTEAQIRGVGKTYANALKHIGD